MNWFNIIIGALGVVGTLAAAIISLPATFWGSWLVVAAFLLILINGLVSEK